MTQLVELSRTRVVKIALQFRIKNSSITTWSRIRLKRVNVTQLRKYLAAFYRSQNIIAVFRIFRCKTEMCT